MLFIKFLLYVFFVFVVIDGSSSETLRKLSDDSSRKHLSGKCLPLSSISIVYLLFLRMRTLQSTMYAFCIIAMSISRTARAFPKKHDHITVLVHSTISSRIHNVSLGHGADLIEDEEDEVTSSLPDRPRPHRKASSKCG